MSRAWPSWSSSDLHINVERVAMVIYTKNDIFLDKTPVPKGWVRVIGRRGLQP